MEQMALTYWDDKAADNLGLSGRITLLLRIAKNY